jgi:hypothetical protein
MLRLDDYTKILFEMGDLTEKLSTRSSAQAVPANAEELKDIETANKKAEQMGLSMTRPGYYGIPGEGSTHKRVGPNVVPIDPNSANKYTSTGQKKDIQPRAKSKQAAPESPGITLPTFAGQSSYTGLEFKEDFKRLMDVAAKRIDNSPKLSLMRDELSRDVDKFFRELKTISNMAARPKDREEFKSRMADFIDKYDIIATNKTLKINKLTSLAGLNKLFGDSYSRTAVHFMGLVRQAGLDLPDATSGDSERLHYIASHSKPNFGEGHYASDGDPVVCSIFNEPIFSDLRDQFKSVYGPVDKNGRVIQSGGDNAELYFKHSVSANASIVNTIEALEQMAEESGQDPADPAGYNGIVKALKEHRFTMLDLATEFGGLGTVERTERVKDSYAKLAQNLHLVDPRIASAIMKHMAENALYDTEVAQGLEVYMPAEGNFPAGDKIVVTRRGTKVERVESVSVKFGSSGKKTYGFATSAANICTYHPNPTYRNLLKSRAGAIGAECGIDSKLLHEPEHFHRMMEESGLAEAFDVPTMERIRHTGIELARTTQEYVRAHPEYIPNKDLPGKYMENLSKEASMTMLFNQLRNYIGKGNQQKLQAILGKNNYDQLLYGKDPSRTMGFFSVMTFGAALKTSNGFSAIQHNHQEVTRDGKYISETEEGSDRLADWQFDYRWYGTTPKGATVGYNPRANDTTDREEL